MCTRLWLLENQIGVSRGQVDPLDVKYTADYRPYVDEFNTEPVKVDVVNGRLYALNQNVYLKETKRSENKK